MVLKAIYPKYQGRGVIRGNRGYSKIQINDIEKCKNYHSTLWQLGKNEAIYEMAQLEHGI